ncbi:Mediator of RNA polymerase II transcription subunit 31 [Zalerion maritima]|uniref:Mediator of RNA polymerase II transcription subunit 31 n=1 Tax=Zalerion maritima TaxID=339359 RepID=A0AAD5WVP9_9PEZI|nr:Mediator of RNA polymerase II transcription subunit 31 [Zalerion maritima]
MTSITTPTANATRTTSKMSAQQPPSKPQEPVYGGFSRFEIELEFVQSLANPAYMRHLANQNILNQPTFVAYLKYLLYWTRPPYLKYLIYPGPTIRHLELLQQERFRKAVLTTDIADVLMAEETKGVFLWHEGKDGKEKEKDGDKTAAAS